jgi:acylphosphatase
MIAGKAQHVLVTGRVQGVGYRAWVIREAAARGLAGWVRNRMDGSVEAVFSGDTSAVDAMIAACRRGPSAAVVAEVRVKDFAGPEPVSFGVLPTV